MSQPALTNVLSLKSRFPKSAATFTVPKSATYLHVPFEFKTEAKQLGAYYDAAKKSWYVLDKNPSKEMLMKLFGSENSDMKLRVYLHPCPENPTIGDEASGCGCTWDEMKAFIAEVKGIGAKYDKNRKMWYIYKNHPRVNEYRVFAVEDDEGVQIA